MDRDLGTDQGSRYSIITLVFFIPYIIFEIPSQFGLRKFGAKIWLGSAVVLWGVSLSVVPQSNGGSRGAHSSRRSSTDPLLCVSALSPGGRRLRDLC